MYGTLPPTAGVGSLLATTGIPFYQVVGMSMIALSAVAAGILLMRTAWRRRDEDAVR